ncbi:hypothetical protein ABZU76_42205 [Amycolatopsis sp. NPDC005232]|uniref:hypothetical protein n=1 Tax=Amycolatopsis sp. NPDC005232 TaxID=3157027 RepID=UPI0033B84514
MLGATDAAFGADKTRWTWKPTAASGFADLTNAWGLPDEAQLRHLGTQQYLLTTDSYGPAAVVPYPQGTDSCWAANIGASNNPHSVEHWRRPGHRPGRDLSHPAGQRLPVVHGHGGPVPAAARLRAARWADLQGPVVAGSASVAW